MGSGCSSSQGAAERTQSYRPLPISAPSGALREQQPTTTTLRDLRRMSLSRVFIMIIIIIAVTIVEEQYSMRASLC